MLLELEERESAAFCLESRTESHVTCVNYMPSIFLYFLLILIDVPVKTFNSSVQRRKRLRELIYMDMII
jgi:hypothetical protein